ncbi:MAG: acetate kinase, partial [Erysipelotrichales bacterium]|nr:acetate kinase [Erysipelotrichales bacterium]
MSKVISVNAGSSSLKFQLFNMPEEEVVCSGVIERIGQAEGIFTIKCNGEKHVINQPFPSHDEAVAKLMEALIEYKVVESLEEIKGAGHRIVQGGAYFSDSAIVDEDSTAKVLELAELAPLHNLPEVRCCQAFQKALPELGNIYVFDTAFHQTMKPASYMYALPYEWYTDYKVRRYGAHGTSHMYVANRTAELMGKDVKDLKIITCHLGNGASITAVDGGVCVNTSMGFTPLGGIMMGTRCGDIDPAIVPYMMKKTGMTPDEMDAVLNKKSGMLGVSGISSDARDVEIAAIEGDPRARLTQEIYVNRIVNVVGGYYMQMGGCDALAFTAGLGENNQYFRRKICEGLEKGMGLRVNYELNASFRAEEVKIST